jgi:hypothetical protein
MRSIRKHARFVGRRHAAGQGLVEFSLVLPMFLTILLGIIEFSFAFNAVLAVNFASRNAALLAAEGGADSGTDCIVLRSIENDITSPASTMQVERVEIYQSDRNGTMVGLPTVYVRGGSWTCEYAGGFEITVPYTQAADAYPYDERCNYLAGCSEAHPALDLVGVKITYRHLWVTPIRSFIGGNPGGLQFDRSNATRMEPIL